MMNVVMKESLKHVLRSRPIIRREISHVEWLYRLSEDEIRDYKEKKFLSIFKKAYQYSSFYKEFYRKAGVEGRDIQTLDDIVKLPILTKDMVRLHSMRILTVPRWSCAKANTSGTTGTPLTVYHTYKSVRAEQAYIWYRRELYGFKFGERKVSIRGNLGAATRKAWEPLSNTLYLSSYQLNEDTVGSYFDEMATFKPKAIEGYPSSIYALAQLGRQAGRSIRIPFCFTSSETLHSFQRDAIQEVFNSEIYDRYGSTERSISLAERPDHSGYYEEPGYSINEYLSDCVISTSLICDGFPLIRYRVDDVIERDGLGNIIAIQGRSDDIVSCQDGTKLGRLDHIFKGVEGILSAQIVQKIKGFIEINIVPESVLTDEIISEISKRLRAKVAQENLLVEFREIKSDDLIYSSREKFSLVKSYL